MHYLILFTIVFFAGIVPAFGPPSWVFAIFFRQHFGLSPVFVVLVTATATTLGRLLLAYMTSQLKPYIPRKYAANLKYSQQLLEDKRKSTWLAIGLFVLSPLPSAQLFEAAGLIDIPLLPLGIAFFVGRMISLSFYVGATHLVAGQLNQIWETGFTSIWAVVVEIFAILCLVALFNVRRIARVARKYQSK